MTVTRCEGHGLGSCKGCLDKGLWNRNWIDLMYKIEGREGIYCSEGVKKLKEEEPCQEKSL